MASTTFSLADALQSLDAEGFVAFEDAGVGGEVAEMERRDFALLSPYGLDYYQRHILNDTRVRSILEALFERCSLGHWLRWNEFPGHNECFGTGGSKLERNALVVHQWSKGSRVVCWSGSHRKILPTKRGSRSTFETTSEALSSMQCEASEKEFPEGCLMIRDPRLYIESRSGYNITFFFTTEQILTHWPKIVLQDVPELRERVANLKTTKIGVNFAFENPTNKTDK